MARAKKEAALTPEERLQAALVPDWEWPYQLPENWCWTTCKRITSRISDGSHNPPKDSGQGIPLLSATNIHDGIIDFENVSRWITEKEWVAENSRTNIEFGDVLLTIVATLGRTAVVDTSEKFALQRSVAVLKPRINSKYLAYCLDMPYIQSFISDNAKGTAQKGFYLNSVENIYIPLAPLSEQQRIVDRIESLFAKLDEAKEKAQAVVDSFETRKAAILHKAFTGELTANWREAHGANISQWKNCTIGDVFAHTTGKALKKSNQNGVLRKYITTSNLYWGTFDFSEVREMYFTEDELGKCTAKKGDLLLCNGGDVGRAAIWDYDYEICLQNHISKLRKKAENVDVPFFYYYFMLSKIDGNIAGRGIGIASLSARDLLSMNVYLPPVAEQQQISRILDAIFAKEQQAKEAAEAVLEKIDLMKKAILARAFRGELGTNVPNDEPAVELLKKIL